MPPKPIRLALGYDSYTVEGDTAKYVPQFGGYCGYAASINRLSPISPEYWQIIDGKLILQHNQRAIGFFFGLRHSRAREAAGGQQTLDLVGTRPRVRDGDVQHHVLGALEVGDVVEVRGGLAPEGLDLGDDL